MADVARIIPPPPDEGGQSARERVNALLAGRDLSQRALAKQAGISPSAFSGWLNGTYAGDIAAVEEKVAAWLNSREKAQEVASALPEKPAWVDLMVSRKVMDALTYAQATAGFVLIYGPPGIGKTHAIEHYKSNNPNVWVTTCRPTIRTLSGVVEAVALAMGIRPVRKARHVSNEITARASGSGGVIVMDDAQHLGDESLEELRYIRDTAGCGLALAGNETVYARITGGARDARFAQLHSRITKRQRLSRPDKADVGALLDAMGVAEIDQRNFLMDKAMTPGALRAITLSWQLAAHMAVGAGKELSLALLKASWREVEDVEWKE